MNIISEITDETFGQKSLDFDNPYIRYGARGIIKRNDGKIAIFNKVNKNEYKLPGGEIENEEKPEEAFNREVLEETGCIIENVNFLGITKELKSHENFQQISYVFKADVSKITENFKLTQKEFDEGGQLIWLDVTEALEKITNCFYELKESKYENMYHSKFINYRDREILKYYIRNN